MPSRCTSSRATAVLSRLGANLSFSESSEFRNGGIHRARRGDRTRAYTSNHGASTPVPPGNRVETESKGLYEPLCNFSGTNLNKDVIGVIAEFCGNTIVRTDLRKPRVPTWSAPAADPVHYSVYRTTEIGCVGALYGRTRLRFFSQRKETLALKNVPRIRRGRTTATPSC